MADSGARPTRQHTLAELAEVLDIPTPVITDEQRAEHRQRMDDGDAQVAAIRARRARHAA